MPKIFLIKNRLHQQQQRLLESQNNLLHKNEDDRLVPPLSPSHNSSDSVANTSRDTLSHANHSPKPSTPTPTPAAPQPEGSITVARSKSRSRSDTNSPVPILVSIPSLSIASVAAKQKFADAAGITTKKDPSLLAADCFNIEGAGEALNLVAAAPTVATTTSTSNDLDVDFPPARKRFHHRRYYFGQQQQKSKIHDEDDKTEQETVAQISSSPTVCAKLNTNSANTTNVTVPNTELPTLSPTPADEIEIKTEPPSAPTTPTTSPQIKPTKRNTNTSRISILALKLRDCSEYSSPEQIEPKILAAETLAALANTEIKEEKPDNLENLEDENTNGEIALESTPPRPRFFSSILGGNRPYSGGAVLTQAQRKEYPVEIFKRRLVPTPREDSDSDSDSDSDGSKLIVDEKPLVPEEKPLSLRIRSSPPPLEKRPSPPPPPEPAVRCSVIQRTPKTASLLHRGKQHEVVLPSGSLEHFTGPEQEEPINYHVPKRRPPSIDSDEEQTDALNAKRLERERNLREARRRSTILAARVLAQARLNPRLMRSIPGILAAAAGHGRTSSSTGAGQGFQGAAGFGNGGTGSSSNQSPSGGAGSPTGFGANGSGGGGGGMGGGRDGRGNYGPNSPPSGALPPFYESLKGGNGMNPASGAGNLNSNSNYLLQNAAAYLMSAAGGASGQQQQLSFGENSDGTGSSSGSSSGSGNNSGSGGIECTTSLITTFPNGQAYGIILKDEPDIECDESKIDIGVFAQNIIQATMGNPGNFNMAAYEDAIMSDLANSQGPNGTIDPLQFTATLMLSSQSDALLGLDAVDLSSFLNRNCDDENSTSPRQDFELASTPSLTPDSVSLTPGEGHPTQTQLDTFHENLMQQITNISRNSNVANGVHGAGPIFNNFERNSNNQQHHMTAQQQMNHQQQAPPPSYQHATRDMMQMQQQHQQQQQQQHAYNHHQQQQQQQQQNNSLLGPNGPHQQHHNGAYPQHGYQPHHPIGHHHHQQQHHAHPHQHGNHNMQHHHHHHHHSSDNSNLSLPSPNAAHTSAYHSMSSAASNSSGASTSGLLDAAASMLDTKPIIQSVSPSLSTGSQISVSNSDSCGYNTKMCLRSPSNCSSEATNIDMSLRNIAAAAAATAAGLLPPTPTVAMLHESKTLQKRLGLPPEVQLEFVNGGHGIKNPLAIENLSTGHHRARSIDCVEDTKKIPNPIVSPPQSAALEVGETGEGSKFVCRICMKGFSLQRLLNRHMKCHSEIKRYLCTFCGKGFNDTFDLKRHTRTHTGVRPYKCNLCEKSFTQRCSLESHCLKVHGVRHQYAYKERRTKMYVCEECGHTTCEPEVHYLHLKENHPYSPALLKFYDKRHFKFTNSQFANNLLGQLPMPVHN